MTETEQMLSAILDCQRIDLLVDRKPLTDHQQKEYELMQARRREGEPLQYIIGHCDFMGLKICVDQRVLVPRPETEIFVDFAMQKISRHYQERKRQSNRGVDCFASLAMTGKSIEILDLGTGSGNIAIALAKNIPSCFVTTMDVSKDAIDLAKYNATENQIDHKIKFIHQLVHLLVSFLQLLLQLGQ